MQISLACLSRKISRYIWKCFFSHKNLWRICIGWKNFLYIIRHFYKEKSLFLRESIINADLICIIAHFNVVTENRSVWKKITKKPHKTSYFFF